MPKKLLLDVVLIRRISVAALIWLPVQAQACPGSADLENGIVLENRMRNFTAKSYIRKLDEYTYGTALIAPIFPIPTLTEEYMGLMEVSLYDERAKIWKTSNYSAGLQELFPLAEGKSATFTSTSITKGPLGRGERTWRWEFSVEVGAPEKTYIGSCTYAVFPLRFLEQVTRPDGEVKQIDGVRFYSPELAFVLFDTEFPNWKYEHVRLPMPEELSEWPFNGPSPKRLKELAGPLAGQ